jgi:predicted enzyme related to lactoylglutathione lyase
MPNPVVHFEVIGKNQQGLIDFYKQAFDWPIEQMPSQPGVPAYAMAHPGMGPNGGINGGIGAAMEGHPWPPHVLH